MTQSQQHLVLLHGWGCDSSTWSPLLPELHKIAPVTVLDLPGFGHAAALDNYTLDAVLDTITAQLPEKCVLIGWSLGGMLAVQLAARLPQKISSVITLAANVKFVATKDYPSAMPPTINCQFNDGFAADPQATLKLFTGLLAQGDIEERRLLKALRAQSISEMNANWLDALKLLAQLDNRSAFSQLSQPGLHLLAEKDVLVPVAAADAMHGLNPQQAVYVIEQAAHAVHWSQPELVAAHIKNFLQLNCSAGLLDKQKVAQSFSRAAATYDEVADLQRAVGHQLFAHLPQHLNNNAVVVDLGSGTGFFTAQLAQKFLTSTTVGLDLAEGMLHYAAQHSSPSAAWLCGDAEKLPLANGSVDVIFSSLAIQWCDDLVALMSELVRVLKPGGKLLLATLGPQTLYELKSAWQQVDNYVHVNRFQSAQTVIQALAAAGLTLDLSQQENRILYFERLTDLTHELKALGAHNINAGKPVGLTGRARIMAFKNAYEGFRTAAGLPATYDVLYFSATKAMN